ncbi:MAG: ATP-binding cassette domain-containing protein [Candidatus Omnitrophica bacterium]|nr:ATP-binding cassette domain-containing protein [Candidatus Omnitrophota bacterium]MBU1809993.1 ATP-binding cassette domain-containing protein [Candidatus Omnitrophota bacterium]MBU2436529.1 ATP-binding cassette domain-containing protein [Candidatus Omnitrophota bacterium]
MLLEVRNLKKYYPIKRGLFYKTVGWIKAVDGVSFSVAEGEILGLVGESGCGKTTLAKVILGLIKPDEGDVYFAKEELIRLSSNRMRGLRKDLQIVFQNPLNSLDPRFTVAKIIQEGLVQFMPGKKGKNILSLSRKILTEVGLSENDLSRYPHEFSGGGRQRISIARSLILNPKLIVLDEPVSSLDVSIQAQVLNLLKRLQQELGLTYIFIAHDLRVIECMSDRAAVMYLGKIVEVANPGELSTYPLHPYTQALFSAAPSLDIERKKKRIILKGDVPSALNPPSGCRFHPRCIYAKDRCKEEEPRLIQKDSRFFACHFPLE